MYLIGDIGNTEIKIYLFNNNFKVINRVNLKTNLINKLYLSKKLNYLIFYKKKINSILFSSVVSPDFKIIKKYIKTIINKKLKELKEIKLKNFIKIKVNKKQVGSDRLANAIGVIDNKSNYIILDFGTATTFDVVVNNQYLGGIIAPGLNISLETLVSKASLIPKINLSKISKIIGKNTKSAVKAGFYHGYIGLINNIVNSIKKQTRKSYKLIITGGFSHLFKNSLNHKTIINKDLTINGLLKIAKKLK